MILHRSILVFTQQGTAVTAESYTIPKPELHWAEESRCCEDIEPMQRFHERRSF
jgi:hypothetical protein